jgi:hypothetical protein
MAFGAAVDLLRSLSPSSDGRGLLFGWRKRQAIRRLCCVACGGEGRGKEETSQKAAMRQTKRSGNGGDRKATELFSIMTLRK